MKNHDLRKIGRCVTLTTTALFAGCAWNSAGASQNHTLQPGETLSTLARKYDLTIHQIAVANHITRDDSLRDGMTLIIPDSLKPVSAPETMQQSARAGKDRIGVRMGPGPAFHRVTLIDSGEPMVVTAVQDGWAQVTLKNGKRGWIRRDLLEVGNKPLLAQNGPGAPSKRNTPHPHPIIAMAVDPHRKSKTRRLASVSASQAKKHHETQHPPKLAHSWQKHHGEEVAAHKHAKHHREEVASHSHRRHHEAVASAHHSSHSRQVAHWAHHAYSKHHGESVAHLSGGANGSDVVRTAYAYRGTPYRYGASGRGGFDCSGFTSYIYRSKGVSLPHSAAAQFERGKRVSRSELKPGDLVFFHTGRRGISHVGIYTGNGNFIHSSSPHSGGVRVDSLDSNYYRGRYRGARRVKN